MIKKVFMILLLPLFIILLAACSSEERLSPSTGKESPPSSGDSQFVQYGAAGYITEIENYEGKNALGTIHVEGSKDNGAAYDNAVVTISPKTKIYIDGSADYHSLKVGMYVNVFFEGPVRESYPVQADAKQINVIPEDPSSGTEDIPENE